MAKLVIEGGRPLSGEITPIGNKNAILKMMAAALLTDEKVTLTSVPAISDVKVVIEILKDLGGAVHYEEKVGVLHITSKGVSKSILNTGLPVTERHNHTFAVSFYKTGLDATVSSLGPDLLLSHRS